MSSDEDDIFNFGLGEANGDDSENENSEYGNADIYYDSDQDDDDDSVEPSDSEDEEDSDNDDVLNLLPTEIPNMDWLDNLDDNVESSTPSQSVSNVDDLFGDIVSGEAKIEAVVETGLLDPIDEILGEDLPTVGALEEFNHLLDVVKKRNVEIDVTDIDPLTFWGPNSEVKPGSARIKPVALAPNHQKLTREPGEIRSVFVLRQYVYNKLYHNNQFQQDADTLSRKIINHVYKGNLYSETDQRRLNVAINFLLPV